MAEKDRNAAPDADAPGPEDAGQEAAGQGAAGQGAAGQGAAADRRQWRYPEASEHPDEEIYVHAPWCKSCGICYSICPHGVLEGDRAGRPVVVHPEKCVACYLCEILCPDMAVTVHKKPRKKASSETAGESDDE